MPSPLPLADRPPRTVLAVVGLLGLLVGCSAGPVSVDPVDAAPADRDACTQLRDALPGQVLDQQPRPVTPDEAAATTAAWGDPAIVLRCGVAPPEALKRSSPCLEIENVGWFAEPGADGYRFTTIDRPTNVEVSVPEEYVPESGPLVDLAAAIESTIPADDPCS